MESSIKIDFCQNSKAMDDYVFEDGSTLKNIITPSDQVRSMELVESARNKKETLVSALDSVISLMKEVECEEKSAEEAKDEGFMRIIEYQAKQAELKQACQRAKETNVMHAEEVSAQKAVLDTKMKTFHRRASSLLRCRDKSLEVLDEMRRTLEVRLASALTKKELAVKEKLEIEAFYKKALACQESQLDELVEESNRLQHEAYEISKLQKFFMDQCYVVDNLKGQISDKNREVILLKKEFDQGILQSLLFILQSPLLRSIPTSILAFSSSSVTTTETSTRYPKEEKKNGEEHDGEKADL